MSRQRARLLAARGVSAALLGLLLCGTSFALAAPAAAVPAPAPFPPGALTPLVDCVQDAPLGAVTARTVVLGYRSSASTAVTLPAGGGANDLSVAPADRGQPTTLVPGEHHGAWLLTVDAQREPALAWRLGDATAVIDGSAPACTDATVLTLSAPTVAAAGSRLSVSAAVTRMLLSAPADGEVEFSLDGGAPVAVTVSDGGLARADLDAGAAGAHTVMARYVPAAGSALRASTASALVTTTPVSAPLSVDANSVVAGSTSARITISRANGAGTATVDYATADGTALAGIDYAPRKGTVTLADGELSATVDIALRSRAPGSRAATFFVLLQRSSAGVTTAAATVRLPAVAAAPAAANSGGTSGAAAGPVSVVRPPDGPSSALPGGDPTAASAASAGSGEDLLLLLGAGLLTVGGVLGVVGLFRAVGARGSAV